MKPSLVYRIAAVLLLVFAVMHCTGFSQVDPRWGVDAVVAAMRTQHFDLAGSSRTYWDLYLAAGYTGTVYLLFSAVLAWQLGGLPAETLARLRGPAWTFALSFVALAALSWRYLFILPFAFSALAAVILIAAAWLASKR